MLEQPQARIENTSNARPEATQNALFHASFNASYGASDVRSTTPKTSKVEPPGSSGELKFDKIPGYDTGDTNNHGSAQIQQNYDKRYPHGREFKSTENSDKATPPAADKPVTPVPAPIDGKEKKKEPKASESFAGAAQGGFQSAVSDIQQGHSPG